jgi:hypothetical protein
LFSNRAGKPFNDFSHAKSQLDVFCGVTDWVLQRFSPEEEQALGGLVSQAADALDAWLQDGLAAAMNRYNRAAEQPDVPGD